MGELGFKIRKEVPKLATGGAIQKLQPGGAVQGPSHEMGGVPAVNAQQEPIAEVEGGERVFSVEDTQLLEQAAMQIMQTAQQDPAAADQMAMELGYKVVEMLVKQETVNPSTPPGQPGEITGAMPGEAAIPGSAVGAGEMMPPGGGAPYMESPI